MTANPLLVRTAFLNQKQDFSNYAYDEEQVRSRYGYFSGYMKDLTLEQNLADLQMEEEVYRRFIPQLSGATISRELLIKIAAGEVRLPPGAERWSLMVKWWKVFSPEYQQALKQMLYVLIRFWQGRYEYEQVKKEVSGNTFNLTARTVYALKKLALGQAGNDLLIVPVQLGWRHRGLSVQQSSHHFYVAEAGLDLLGALNLLLLHEPRLRHYNDLWMDCAGNLLLHEEVHHVPCLSFEYGDEIRLRFGEPDETDDRSGSATIFSL